MANPMYEGSEGLYSDSPAGRRPAAKRRKRWTKRGGDLYTRSIVEGRSRDKYMKSVPRPLRKKARKYEDKFDDQIIDLDEGGPPADSISRSVEAKYKRRYQRREGFLKKQKRKGMPPRQYFRKERMP